MKILKESYEQAKELLAANRDAMDEIAAYLIQKETITGKEFMEIFHQVIAKRNGNAEEAVENPENTETENTALPEAKYKKKAKRPGGSRENDLCTLGIFNITVPKRGGSYGV